MKCRSVGTAQEIIQPFLDNQVEFRTFSSEAERPVLTIERATTMIKDAFRSAAERDSCTGDAVSIVIAEAGKAIKTSTYAIRED